MRSEFHFEQLFNTKVIDFNTESPVAPEENLHIFLAWQSKYSNEN